MGCHRQYRERANAVGHDKRSGSVLAGIFTRDFVGSHFLVVSANRFHHMPASLGGFYRAGRKDLPQFTVEDAIIVPNPDGTQRLIHKPSVDQKVAQWIEARFPRRIVVVDDQYHFRFDVKAPQSHHGVSIRRTKNCPENIRIQNRIAMEDEQRTKLKGMPDEAREFAATSDKP